MSIIVAKLALDDFGDHELVDYAKDKVIRLTGNPKYSEPFVQRDEVSGIIPHYEDALVAAVNGGKADTQAKNDLRESLEDALTYLANECSYRARKDKTMFLSSGFDIRSSGSAQGLRPKPTGLEAEEGMEDASIALDWNPDPKADSYVVQMTTNIGNANSWVGIGFPTAAHFVATGLTKGQQVWFRVAAVNPAGVSDWSDPANRYVT